MRLAARCICTPRFLPAICKRSCQRPFWKASISILNTMRDNDTPALFSSCPRHNWARSRRAGVRSCAGATAGRHGPDMVGGDDLVVVLRNTRSLPPLIQPTLEAALSMVAIWWDAEAVIRRSRSAHSGSRSSASSTISPVSFRLPTTRCLHRRCLSMWDTTTCRRSRPH